MKSSTIGRLFLGSLTFASALAVGNEARGADTNAPTYGEISVGRLTTPPVKNVGGVPAGASVPGIYVVKPNFGGGMQQVMITADEKTAAQLRSPSPFGGREETPSACVSESHRNGLGFSDPSDPTKPREWSETMSVEATAYPKAADNPMSGVVAVHSERIVESSANTATLESVDAWVDPGTRGAKLISKSSLPLKLVRGPGFGLKVWAGRDERPDGKRFVQFIVSRPKSNPGDTVSRTSQMWTMRQDGNITHASGCGHMRVALPLDAASKDGKNGEMATVVATVILPALDNDSATPAPAAPPAAAAAAPVVAPPPQVTFVKGKPVSKKPSPNGGGAAAVPTAFFPNVPNSDGTRKEHEVRSRMVNVQVSVSQISKEKEPLVSVSSTWGGREQVDRVADMAGGGPTTNLSPF